MKLDPPTGLRAHREHAGAAAQRASRARLAAGIVLCLTALGCSGTAQVKSQRTPAFDVSSYRTFDWGIPVPAVVADEERARDAAVLEYTIRNAIERQLLGKGYQRAEGASPDFQIDFGVRLEEKSTDTFGEYITYRERGGQQGMGPAFVFGYEEGILVIDVTDARSRERAWTGSARTVLDDGQDVAKLEAAVGEIMAPFPAAAGAAATRSAADPGALRPPEP